MSFVIEIKSKKKQKGKKSKSQKQKKISNFDLEMQKTISAIFFKKTGLFSGFHTKLNPILFRNVKFSPTMLIKI